MADASMRACPFCSFVFLHGAPQIRRSLKAKDSAKYGNRVDALAARKERLEANQLPEDELEDAFEE